MNWRERVIDREHQRSFTEEDRSDSANWNTCAVWEQRTQYPGLVPYVNEVDLYGPTDTFLKAAGLDFCDAVYENDFRKAHHSLDMIEGRIMALKRKAGSNENGRD